jgi:hypothetical protein
MPKILSSKLRAAAVTAAAAAVPALIPATAAASHSQVAIMQDGSDLSPASAMNTLEQFRSLGASTVRVVIPWAGLAPSPNSVKAPKVDLTNSNNYITGTPYDTIVRDAAQLGLTVDMTVTGGAPRWAEASNPPPVNESKTFLAWRPNAGLYGDFVKAVGSRYSGHFKPPGAASALPAVHFWALFNEPNFGEDLGPQASNDSTQATGPMMYRGLVNAGYHALVATGHQRNTILIGELAAQGNEYGPYPRKSGGVPGNYGQTRPLLFIRELYCVNPRFGSLGGGAARAAGCPTTGAAIARFRRNNPGLFNASGFSDHPYPQGESPVSRAGNKPDYARFQDLGTLGATLDRALRHYGSGKHYAIYNTEYGYITRPPKGAPYVSPTVAAYYINWAEYLSWRQGRVQSTMQYLLMDPAPTSGAYSGFASGLQFYGGRHKPGFDAYRLPVYMPRTNIGRGPAEVWGDVRPAPFMAEDSKTAQSVAIQLNGKTIKTVTVRGSTGYFDVRVKFPRSGMVRLAYTYPKNDPLLAPGYGGTVYSRSFKINVR